MTTIEEWLYDRERDKYFEDMAAACDWYDSWGHPRPEHLAACEQISIAIDAASIVDDALVDHHENAGDGISAAEIDRLQTLLDEWCEKQGAYSWFPTTMMVAVPRAAEAVR